MEYNFTIEKMSQNKTKTLNQLSPTAAINKSYIYIYNVYLYRYLILSVNI